MDDNETSFTAAHRFRVVHSFERYELWVEDRIATFDSRAELDRCIELINDQRQADEP